jgi:hypothetical protein
MDTEQTLAEIADWLRGVGYGIDWFTGSNHQLPESLRRPLAHVWWADAQNSDVESSDETVEDYYNMLAEELHWTS